MLRFVTTRPSKPKVLIYRDFLLYPSETFIKSQAEGLRDFVAHYAGLRLVDGIQLPPERVTTVQGAGLFGRVESRTFTVTGVSPRALVQLHRVQARLVHAHFGVDATRIMRTAELLRLPLVVTLHDYDVTTSDSDLRKLAPYLKRYIRRRPRLNRQAKKFIAVSKFIKQHAIARGFDEKKIVVHYIGIDTDRFEQTDRLERDPIVLFVGRLVEKKGCPDLIRAMALVQRSRPDAELVMVGDGPLRQELEALAGSLLKRYRFIGAQTSDEVRGWYARAQIFCGPSVTAASGETEGLPITVQEALATGLPVVSTYHSGIPEVVLHEETGLLVPERSPDELGAALISLLSNPDLAARLGQAGRTLVKDQFCLSKQTAALERIYEETLAESNKSV
jgi:glycosyltransferase involved in cell wall biosynthesis